jgi:hypothetical protein
MEKTDDVRADARGDDLMFVDDVRGYLRCGASKARLVMEEVGAVRVGSSKAVFRAELVSHLREHGGVAVRWPKRRG